jgi:glutathione S-transferase
MYYVYHIAREEDWKRAQADGLYKIGSLHRSFEQDGFIHLAYATQVNVVADLIYSHTTELLLLTIDPRKLTAVIKEEKAEYPNELFPHLYGPLNVDAVISVSPYNPLPNGRFPEVKT